MRLSVIDRGDDMALCRKEIDFSKIQMALFDFDDTLFIHTEHRTSEDSSEYFSKVLKYNDKLHKHAVSPWVDTNVSRHMSRFIEYLKVENPNIRFGLVSAVSIPPIAEAKVREVKEHYGVDMENFCTNVSGDMAHNKAEIVQLICQTYFCKPEEIVFVDDYYANVTACADLGVIAVSPMEVVNFIDAFEHGELARENR